MSQATENFQRHISNMAAKRPSIALNYIGEACPAMMGFTIYVQHIDDDRENNFPGYVDADVWTDGKRIHYTKGFEERNKESQMAVVAKHLFKIALCHVQRARRMKLTLGEKFDVKLYVLATDILIYQSLETNKRFGTPKPTLGEVVDQYNRWRRDRGEDEVDTTRLSDWTSEKTYYFLLRWQEEIDKETEKEFKYLQNLLDGLQVDIDFDSSDSLDGRGLNESVKDDMEQMFKWRQRFEQAQGTDAGGMLRRLSNDLPERKTPWNHLLHAATLKAVTKLPRTDHTRPSRNTITLMTTVMRGKKFAFEPAVVKNMASPKIAICCDTSGSIDQGTLDLIAAEMELIQKAKKTELRIIVGDARVEGVFDVPASQIREVCKNVKFSGDGGTDFRPLIAKAEEWNPDIIIYMTDLMGSFPEKAPRCKMIWAAIPMPGMNVGEKVPFGEVIVLE